ncbi:MAG: molybdate ABC transporter permease subunit [Proteobacteria bacterium]|jgi:molybdate transport system permease protein|nr:molybdate ABC transporter permease subunit [Desulfocapsa sp.]MBU3943253.1 molybdate ABC transporter permease subunit [Pseudomonadota bacterium]MCG2743352.1 molybdate ABC transporter permease subunit [Desulfobacteraceae bacterium]MBU3982460.1 molybdate ABC transporter permease subunit [Pseudomonadota bacterium]MBU4027889.1 molybdate ABC transporter permease subunit [Pseudomonadota bacterium]
MPDLSPLWLTLRIACFATLIAFGFAVAFAWIIARFSFWGRDLLDAILTLPLVMPPTVLGYYLIVLWGRNGWLGGWLNEHFGITLMFTWQGAVLAATVVAFPLLFKSARAAFEGVDTEYEKAARILGDNEMQVFFRITLPLAARGLVAGTMLAFARAMGDFGATLMVAGNIEGRTQTVAMAVFDAVQVGDYRLANTLVAIMSVVCVTILVLTNKLAARRQGGTK